MFDDPTNLLQEYCSIIAPIRICQLMSSELEDSANTSEKDAVMLKYLKLFFTDNKSMSYYLNIKWMGGS